MSEGVGELMLGDAPHELVLHARCPICRARLLSVSALGRVLAGDLHPLPLAREWGRREGYGLCDECSLLAQLPADLTLN